MMAREKSTEQLEQIEAATKATEVDKTEVKREAVDAQAFVQNKLRVLNQKSGGRYGRDAMRVVQHSLNGGK